MSAHLSILDKTLDQQNINIHCTCLVFGFMFYSLGQNFKKYFVRKPQSCNDGSFGIFIQHFNLPPLKTTIKQVNSDHNNHNLPSNILSCNC